MDGPLTTAPWRRAPLLLIRRPVVFLAIFASVAVLGVAAASGVLFASTLATASVRAQTASDCVESAMPQFRSYAVLSGTAALNTVLTTAMAGVSAAPAPYAVDVASATVGRTELTLFARAGATQHIQHLTPNTGARGAWLPQNYAKTIHARPGTTLRTSSGGTITVAGIYRDLAPDPFKIANLPPYWCTWKDLALQRLDFPTPPLLLVDVGTLDASRPDLVEATSYDPIPAITITSARSAEMRAAAAFAVYVKRSRHDLQLSSERPDPLQAKIEYADRVHDGLIGSVIPIDAAGTIVALLLVIGAGGFWASHRSREIRLLTSRGVAPRHLGAKAVLETAPAAVLGLVAGVILARVLVQQVGPAPAFTPDAGLASIAVATAVLLAALGIVFVIGMRAGRDRPLQPGRASRAHLVPWELALVAIAYWFAHILRTSSGVVVDKTVVTVRPILLLFPIVGATGMLLLFARLIWLLRRPVSRLAPHLGRAGYLAVRRIVRAPAVALGLLVGTALPVALLTFAGTVNYGMAHEITAKYQTNLGAPHVLLIIGAHSNYPRLRGHGSAVVSYAPSEATLPDGSEVGVLGVDPRTFSRFAFVDSAQAHDIDRLTGEQMIAVNFGDLAAPRSVHIGSSTVAVETIARHDVFPGLRVGAFPLVIINRARLDHIDPTADRRNQIWTDDAQANAARQTVLDDGYTVLAEVDPQLRLDDTGLLPVTWIFGYLRALAVLIGAVAVAGLVFALAARTQQRTVAYVMSRRMGMRQAAHLRSLLYELGVLIGVGWAGGVAAGSAAFAAIVSALDIYPQLPPGAQFALPASVVVGTAVAVVVVVSVASLAAHRLAERAEPADVLRLE